jgi:hypothetical protein
MLTPKTVERFRTALFVSDKGAPRLSFYFPTHFSLSFLTLVRLVDATRVASSAILLIHSASLSPFCFFALPPLFHLERLPEYSTRRRRH